MRIRDEALVLRRIPFRNTSLVVHFLTRERGFLAALAKGVRKSRRGERAALAGFHTVEVLCQGRASGGLVTLTGVEIHTSRHHIQTDAKGLAAAQLLLEIAYRHCPPGEPQPVFFAELTEGLDLMDAGGDPLTVTVALQGRMLRQLGYGWQLDRCAGCGGEGDFAWFSPKSCRAVCRGCGEPWADRLLPLGEGLKNAMEQLAWPPDFNLLSPADGALLYHLENICLTRHGGEALKSDPSFRRAFVGLNGEEA
ncbi:MAG: DNA repair protein RecO [Magnetococcales bacterium]|nr:DNA repair protein RecO [Magnetococcales bacterium]